MKVKLLTKTLFVIGAPVLAISLLLLGSANSSRCPSERRVTQNAPLTTR